MSNLTSDIKRTRSQLILPALDPSTLGRSPLKDARSALRNAPNSQIQLSIHQLPSKLQSLDMGGDATDDEDEILLSPDKRQKAKKRISEEQNGDPHDARQAKRVKMGILSSKGDAENHHPSSQPEKLSSITTELQPPQIRSVSPASPGRIPHIDLKTIPPSPWRATSPTRQKSQSKDAGMDVNTIHPHPPTTPRPTPAIFLQPETPEAQKNQNTADSRYGPMSPLTPLPPTPAIFGNTIRAFTAGRRGGAVTAGGLGTVPVRGLSFSFQITCSR